MSKRCSRATDYYAPTADSPHLSACFQLLHWARTLQCVVLLIYRACHVLLLCYSRCIRLLCCHWGPVSLWLRRSRCGGHVHHHAPTAALVTRSSMLQLLHSPYLSACPQVRHWPHTSPCALLFIRCPRSFLFTATTTSLHVLCTTPFFFSVVPVVRVWRHRT